MNRSVLPDDLLLALRSAYQQLLTASDEAVISSSSEEEQLSPRALAAATLADLAQRARDHCWTAGETTGEALCDLLDHLCAYIVDPICRDRMIALAGDCLQVLEDAALQQGLYPDDIVERLRYSFEFERPAENDAAAIARALGMSEEDARAFGLIGEFVPVDPDDEFEAQAAPALEREGSTADLADESVEDVFWREATTLVNVTLPRALDEYWRQQSRGELLLAVRRAFHTLKGDALVVARSSDTPDLQGLAALAEAAEDIIDERLGESDMPDIAPALPAGAFGLFGETQSLLARRLETRTPVEGEEKLLKRLQAMQARARALAAKEQQTATERVEMATTTVVVPEPLLKGTSDLSASHNRLLVTFLSESRKLLSDLHRALARLSDDTHDENALVRARVKMHTLKGSAALAGDRTVAIERIAHQCEDLLELIEDYQLRGALIGIPAPVLNGVLDADDALHALLDELQHSLDKRGQTVESPTSPPAPDTEALIARLRTIREAVERGEFEDAAIDSSVATVESSPLPVAEETESAKCEPDEVATPLVPQPVALALPQLAPLAALVSVPLPQPKVRIERPHAAAETVEQEGDARSLRDKGLHQALRALDDQQMGQDTMSLLLRGMAQQAAEARQASSRLRSVVASVERELAGLRRVLVQTTRRSGDWDALEKEEYTSIDVLLMQLDEVLSDQKESETLLRRTLTEARATAEAQAEALTRVQQSLLTMSMVPLSDSEARLDHAVRSVARRLNKPVVFSMEGGEVTLDSRIAESLFNPLMLLINNALDHGIEEYTNERLAAGKPAEGHITVRGRTDGDSVVVEISDDGQGMDPDRIVAVAVTKGVVDAHRAAALSEEQRLALIWHPGFSTARQVGAISGRGMGMTSVQSEIAALQGRVEIRSRVGEGTTVTITLPRSLAMMRLLLIREGESIVAVPMTDLAATHALSVKEIISVPGARLARLGERTLTVYPVQLSSGPTHEEGVLLELVGDEGGILVDDVVQSKYLPVRPAPPYLQRSCCLIGYALGAGGTIIPVLDVAALVARAIPLPLSPVASAGELRSPVLHTQTVLVVDDSQTMRRALAQSFGKAGFMVREASQGYEALSLLGSDPPALITLDMEMPGLDGLETLAAIRLLPEGATIPIFMITSRQQARHRQAALAAGVTRYFTKPYDEDELVGAARLALAGGLSAVEAAS